MRSLLTSYLNTASPGPDDILNFNFIPFLCTGEHHMFYKMRNSVIFPGFAAGTHPENNISNNGFAVQPRLAPDFQTVFQGKTVYFKGLMGNPCIELDSRDYQDQ